ncbi:hypothetical protein F1649_15635 [Arcticibacter tournemirensis]|uniref:NERD domain-containing protein n=1 Tax=Arcticibacter tournemirensis TaxID=699437 RepID=A0A5M9H1T5_9SPHI|nr:hypothetical protein [Arcticibacter tournemirensis]KAA8480055.1 hypothetical protein F1649_15635 [Arcticibacter tournemirensis]
MDKLEAIARELKERVAQFDPDIFARQMTSYINGITLPWNISIMKGLVSPFRQLFYLLNLNITSPTRSYKKYFDQNQDWPALKKKLDEMETIHKYEYGELKPFAEHLLEEMGAEEVVRRRQIGSSTYTAFFHVGPLHYEEQAIEKITELYKNFDAELTDKFGWNSSDILAIYDKLDALLQERQDKAFLKQPKKQLSQDEFKAEILTAMANGSTFQDAMLATSDAPTGMFEYVTDPSSTNMFTLDDLDGIPKPLVDLVLQELTVSRYTDDTYLYFSQPNQLYKKPIYCFANGSYLLLDHRVLLSAMSGLLQQKCAEIIKNQNRITVARDKYLERKLESIFEVFYQSNPNVKIIPSYYLEQGGNERDLLVLDGKTALIIEAKAGKIREPIYDPDKAYNRIWQDFKDTIDYGYEQAFSVKEKFLAKLPFDIYDKKKNVLMTIDPSILGTYIR